MLKYNRYFISYNKNNQENLSAYASPRLNKPKPFGYNQSQTRQFGVNKRIKTEKTDQFIHPSDEKYILPKLLSGEFQQDTMECIRTGVKIVNGVIPLY